jgi:hypothetical protein
MTNTLTANQFATPSETTGKTALWAGRVLTGLPLAFLLMDAVMKLFKPDFVVQATVKLGFSESIIVPLGIVLLACTLLYAIPRTAILGAVLLTGYLGGAVAANILAGTPVFNSAFPILLAVMFWGGLRLRDPRVRNLVAAR